MVLCGPGNNGGDGFVAARHLNGRGNRVEVFLFGNLDQLKGDAAVMARKWLEIGTIQPSEDAIAAVKSADVVIDALFGAGLTRPLDGIAAAVVSAIAGRPEAKVIAVDVPSGLDGTTAEPVGDLAAHADKTITFFRLKPAHVLYPGRTYCGEIVLADIGIPDDVFFQLEDTRRPDDPKVLHAELAINPHGMIRHVLDRRIPDHHKYDHGHALVLSGPQSKTGAARLAAKAALRCGAGLVTIASPPNAIAENAAHLTAIMLTECDMPDTLRGLLADGRKNAVLVGPGYGVGEHTREMVLTALEANQAGLVFDADALTSFADPDHSKQLFSGIKERAARYGPGTSGVVFTPHEGEFQRLFPDVIGGKVQRARQAADKSGAIVVLKGPDTVIASPYNPSGRHWIRAFVNTNA
ncbi:MAG: NAD(P)H-hydrate epimerase, partial [Pseudomonadota bacterium]